jgi:hypothetical protein
LSAAEQLKADASYEVARNTPLEAAWGTRARSSSTISPYKIQSDAVAEAARQLALLQYPLAEDELILAGDYTGLEGAMVIVQSREFGYGAGVAVLVTGVTFEDAENMSQLTILRRLA